MASKHQMFRSSMVVGLFSLLGGLSGILVDTSIAAKLGLSRSSDAFYVAFTIPYIITNLISATGQFSLVPFFAALDARHSSEQVWRGFSYAVNMVGLGLGAVAVLGVAVSPWLIQGIAPGLSREQLELASGLSRWLFLIIIPAGVAEAFRSFLLSQHRFAIPSAAGLFRNVTVIASILLTFNRYGPYSIVVGYIAGYLVQFLVLGGQLLVGFSVRYFPTLAGSGEAFRNLRGAGKAQVASAGAWQIVVIVERIIASFLPAGTLTALSWGFKILSTLAELLAGSVGTAALPSLARAVARRDEADGRKTFRDTVELSLAVMVPAMVFCVLLPTPIVRLVFQRGNFTPQATALMAIIFLHYSLSLIPFGLIRVLTFYLFARNEFSLFFRLSLLQYGLTVLFDLFYVGLLRTGAPGIPWALLTSLGITLALAFGRNMAEMRRALDRTFAVFALKNLLGFGLVAASVVGLRTRLAVPATAFGVFGYLCLLCGVGTLIFLLTLTATRAIALSQLGSLGKSAEDT